MNTETAKILCKITTDFYSVHAASFSATRSSPWTGWERCLATLQAAGLFDSSELSVFDLACGNLRFESFIKSALPLEDKPTKVAPWQTRQRDSYQLEPKPTEVFLSFYAVDNCDTLVFQEHQKHRVPQASRDPQAPQEPPEQQSSQKPQVHYQSLDIMGVLVSGLDLKSHIAAPLCDLSVSFGFMHHVPSFEYRKRVMQSLIKQTRPGGYVIVSFWQFLNNTDLAKKARIVHERAVKELELQHLNDLESGDYLLGWQNIPGAYRYCHSFSEAEIDLLIQSVKDLASPAFRFTSDGRTNNLNTYVGLKVL